jgi:hypothetical protein
LIRDKLKKIQEFKDKVEMNSLKQQMTFTNNLKENMKFGISLIIHLLLNYINIKNLKVNLVRNYFFKSLITDIIIAKNKFNTLIDVLLFIKMIPNYN